MSKALHITLYIAASLEGFIADKHGKTDWVLDDALYEETARAYGCICMGRTTYEEYGGPAFTDVQHIVLTHKLPKRAKFANVHFVASVEDAMACAQKLGFKKLLVIGGAKTNQSFMQSGVVDEVYTDIHPFLLEEGLPMFGDFQAKFDFRMTSHTWHDDGFMHAEYTIGQTHKAIATIIIRDTQGNYFVHRRRKDKKYFPGKYGLGAGGKLDALETPQAAAVRELQEETGLKTPVRHCFDFDYRSSAVTHRIHVFETTVKNQKDYQNPAEWDKVAWVNGEELNEMASSGQLCDDTAILYAKYKEVLAE